MSSIGYESVAGRTRAWASQFSRTQIDWRPRAASRSLQPLGEIVRPKDLRIKDVLFPSLQSGDTFAGYRIMRELGQGGMGIVFLAEGTNQKIVALKISRLNLQKEALMHAMASGRRYKGLVDALDWGTCQYRPNENYQYLAIEYIAGPTLDKMLRHDVPPKIRVPNPLPPERAAAIARKIALAAGELHCAGVVHSDIKTANVILKNQTEVALLDYGLAKRLPIPVSGNGLIIGTMSYMSPEQLRGESYGPPADVFAIGVVLWELLTGNRAFEHRKLQRGIGGEGYDPLPPLPPHLPIKYQMIISKALALNPEDRYLDGHDLARALAEV